jgi:hypothetical protein
MYIDWIGMVIWWVELVQTVEGAESDGESSMFVFMYIGLVEAAFGKKSL